MSLENEYNYNNYPELRQDKLISEDDSHQGDIHHGMHAEGLGGTGSYAGHAFGGLIEIQPDTIGANSHHSTPADSKIRSRFNRAHLNVDQYNYLAGRINSISKIRPYTFTDYYELYPYTSGEYLVPPELFSVEFKIDAPRATKFVCVADNLTEAKGRLWKTEIVGEDPVSWAAETLYLSESGGITSSARDLVYYEEKKRNDGGTFNQAVGGAKNRVYNFLVLDHRTGWSLKRNPFGYEEWEDQAWLDTDAGGSIISSYAEQQSLSQQMEPMTGSATRGGDGLFEIDPRSFDGSKVIGMAQRLGIPIKDHTDLPGNYQTTINEVVSSNVQTNIYDLEVVKQDRPIANGAGGLPAAKSAGGSLPDSVDGNSTYNKSVYSVGGSFGYLHTAFGGWNKEKFGMPYLGAGFSEGGMYGHSATIDAYLATIWGYDGSEALGDPPAGVPIGYGGKENYYVKAMFTSHHSMTPSSNQEIFLSKTKKCDVSAGLDGIRDVRAYDGYKQSGTHWTDSDHIVPDKAFYGAGICPENDTTDAENVPNNITQYMLGQAPTNYTFLDRMPDYVMNHHNRIHGGVHGDCMGCASGRLGGGTTNAPADCNVYVWHEDFYTNNDIYIARGFGTQGKVGVPAVWSRDWGGGEGLDAGEFSHNMLTGCEDEWDGATRSLDCVSHNGGKTHPWKNFIAGFSVGYNFGEVYLHSVLRAKHLMINKPQHARVSDEHWNDHKALPDNETWRRYSEMQEHTESYIPLPVPLPRTATSIGQASHPWYGVKYDPNYLQDPDNRILATNWISTADVKAKAEEMGFIFEFRRLSVPFKLQTFDFTYGNAKAFARLSGTAIYNGSMGSIGNAKEVSAGGGGGTTVMATGLNSKGAPVGNGLLDNANYFFTGVWQDGWLDGIGAPVQQNTQRVWQQAPIPDNASTEAADQTAWPIVEGSSASTAFAHAAQMKNNIDNGIYWNDYTTSNPIFWVDPDVGLHYNDDNVTKGKAERWPDGDTFWCRGSDCSACIDYRNLFGGDAHQGEGCSNTNPVLDCITNPSTCTGTDPTQFRFYDFGDCFECSAAEKAGGTCTECPRFAGLLNDEDYNFLELKGSHNNGVFEFKATGYTPFINSLKTFVWAESKSEIEWVKPVGIGTRYAYRYRDDDWYELYRTDSIKEQFIHPDSSDPYRVETVSSWLGNYVFAGGYGKSAAAGAEDGRWEPWEGFGNTINAPGRAGYQAPLSGHAQYTNNWGVGIGGGSKSNTSQGMPNAQAVTMRSKRSAYPWGETDGYDVDHYKIVWHLGLLHYNVQPLIPVTATNPVEYKNWMLNMQERLFPKYYYFQEESSKDLSTGHAAFGYIEPDIYYGDFKVANFAAEHGTSSEGNIVWESGMMISSLDIFDGYDAMMGTSVGMDAGEYGTDLGEVWNAGGDNYILGIRNFEIDRGGGDKVQALPWAVDGLQGVPGKAAGASNTARIIKDNSVPSIFTDFIPKIPKHNSGVCWQKMDITASTDHFLDFQHTDVPKGTKVAIQFYINNTVPFRGKVCGRGGTDAGYGGSEHHAYKANTLIGGPTSMSCWNYDGTDV